MNVSQWRKEDEEILFNIEKRMQKKKKKKKVSVKNHDNWSHKRRLYNLRKNIISDTTMLNLPEVRRSLGNICIAIVAPVYSVNISDTPIKEIGEFELRELAPTLGLIPSIVET